MVKIIKKLKWWEKLKDQCPSCKRYLALEFEKETYKYYHSVCRFCGFRKRTLIRWAEYKTKGGKTFMKRQGQKEFQEVELKKINKYIKVVPVLDLKNNENRLF